MRRRPITTGEGGHGYVTDDDALAERVKVMRLHGISRDVFDRYTSNKPSWFYEVIAPGFKYNMTDVAAAIGCAPAEASRGVPFTA
jgi:dTDP-4-amino-4,6-dideoxygalactose transaminase